MITISNLLTIRVVVLDGIWGWKLLANNPYLIISIILRTSQTKQKPVRAMRQELGAGSNSPKIRYPLVACNLYIYIRKLFT